MAEVAHPAVVSREEWLAQRLPLLAEEKELTRLMDRVNAKRRRLPMVRVEKEYVFDTPEGKKSLLDLFDGKRQLIVYHFMYGPDDEKPCDGCEGLVDEIGGIAPLAKRDTAFTLISRGPLARLEKFKAEKGWKLPWISSFGSDFNYDFHVTLDPAVTPAEYNYKPVTYTGEMPGFSVFFRLGDEIFHTYSRFARGGEGITDTYYMLDLTPYGRQEDFEDSPDGWPQKPTYG